MPVPQNFVHIILGSDTQQLFLITLPRVFIFVVALVFAVMAVEASHLSADVLKVLLDANLGKALGVLLTGFIEHLAFNVNIMGPVFGFEEGGLGEAWPNSSDQEGSEGHHEQNHPSACL